MKKKGFSLIELMIVIAIIGILAAIAVPSYQKYTRRARASELTHAASPFKLAVEECFQLTHTLIHCNNSEQHIPAEVTDGVGLVQSITVKAGVIAITPRNKDGFTAADTYTLTPHIKNNQLRWST